MKLKLNFNYHAVINYFLILVIILNIVVLFYLYNFLRKQVYDTVIYERNPIYTNMTKTGEDINLEKFRAIIDKIENKSTASDNQTAKNIFY